MCVFIRDFCFDYRLDFTLSSTLCGTSLCFQKSCTYKVQFIHTKPHKVTSRSGLGWVRSFGQTWASVTHVEVSYAEIWNLRQNGVCYPKKRKKHIFLCLPPSINWCWTSAAKYCTKKPANDTSTRRVSTERAHCHADYFWHFQLLCKLRQFSVSSQRCRQRFEPPDNSKQLHLLLYYRCKLRQFG